MEEKYKTNVSLCTLVFNENGEVLLMRRYNTGYEDSKYEFPSGHIEKGETMVEGAMREVIQETSIIINEEDMEYFGCVDNNVSGKHINFLYRCLKPCKKEDAKIQEPDECDDLKWFGLEDLLKGTNVEELSIDTLRFLLMIKTNVGIISFTGKEERKDLELQLSGKSIK